MKSQNLNRLDACGSVLSTLCAVHCLCMPIVVGLLPALGLSFLADQRAERLVTGAMVLFAAACLWLGCREHRRWGLFTLLGAGAALIGYAQFDGHDCCAEHAFHWPDALLMTIGGLLIATSHFLNRRFRACCRAGACGTHGVNLPGEESAQR